MELAHALDHGLAGFLVGRDAEGRILLNEAARKAPLHELVDIMDVGYACTYLATEFAHRVTGGTVYVDGGANVMD